MAAEGEKKVRAWGPGGVWQRRVRKEVTGRLREEDEGL